MSLVRSKDTAVELSVRRAVHSMGYRYRLHVRALPGQPDLVFPRRRLALFVHGCFWHRHPGCPLARLPKSKLDFWEPKLEGNRTRDLRVQEELRELGWGHAVVWECEAARADSLRIRLVEVLGG
jgi:DNA mismatch endonuclease, patch repair protein